MKALLYILLSVTLLVRVAADEASISGNYLSLTTGQDSAHVLSGIYDPVREAQQLRIQKKAVAPMFGGKNEGERGGMRILWQEEGESRTAEWQVSEQTDDTLHLVSENARATATISLTEGESRFSLSLQWEEESPLQHSAILWEWLLEVGGDFFAVPTEGIADHQILPIATGGGEHRLKIIPVERQGEASNTLAEPWWAVADRNRAAILVCRIGAWGGKESIILDRKSGVQGGTDAFAQTMRLPRGEANKSREMRASIMLFSHLQLFNALGESTLWYLSAKNGKLELQGATCRTVPGGDMLLRAGDREVARWSFGEWAPGQPLSFSADEGRESLPSPMRGWTIEYHPRGEAVEVITIYREDEL